MLQPPKAPRLVPSVQPFAEIPKFELPQAVVLDVDEHEQPTVQASTVSTLSGSWRRETLSGNNPPPAPCLGPKAWPFECKDIPDFLLPPSCSDRIEFSDTSDGVASSTSDSEKSDDSFNSVKMSIGNGLKHEFGSKQTSCSTTASI
eukprot:TRINITY_DN77100_c0_g1_i1.p1 TRINITY_DN77100_c0_g1~~TRINITY_DN77100_c0_g1_i1.p1  ORF type:complete len:146 (-),score=22.45 TRINITY_DN77100_c0_g1_i1:378-815(-)